MNNLIVSNNQATMSSREIAEFAGKDHSHVLRDIRKMICDLDGDPELDHVVNIVDFRGYQDYVKLPKNLSLTLVAGYSYVIRKRIIDRWQELEALQKPALPNYQEALRQLADQLDINVQQQALITQQKPAVEFVERYIESSGNKGFRDVCKLLKAKENQFREFLLDQKIMYRLDGNLTPYGNHLDAGRFEVNAGISDSEHAYTQAKFTPKGINWVAGLWAVHNLKG